MASENSKVSGIINTSKELLAFLRDLLLFILILLLLFFPKRLNETLVRAGFEEGSFVGFKWKASLQKSDQALKEAQNVITGLNAQLDSISRVLAQAKNEITDTSLKNKLAKLENESIELKKSTLQTQNAVSKTIANNASFVTKAQEAVNEGNAWGIVFSGDVALSAAKYERDVAAPLLNIPNVTIFLRQGSYRSVAIVDDRNRAQEVLLIARKRRPDAYIVAMSTWCQDANDKGEYKECLSK